MGGGAVVAWRLDQERYRDTWDSGVGASLAGGRWNSVGVPAVYCALDPATAILEVAVHTGFDDLDAAPRVLTSLTVAEPARLHVVEPSRVPNPRWLHPGPPSRNQRRWGDGLLGEHGMIVIPSAVSEFSWNLVFRAGHAGAAYVLRSQHRFGLDTRLVAGVAS